jgi:hypothetical protein
MTAASDSATARVGRYDIVREIGRGGMAVVHLARQPDLDRDIALKELQLFRASDPSPARRFLQESRIAAALTHPNVVTVYDYFEHEGTAYIAMEYLERGSLRPFIGHTSVAENVGVLEGLLAGIDHAARCDVVHRDIKPENLLVTPEGRIKVADFGLARASSQLQQSAGLTRTGVPIGTPWYMAPEQVRDGAVGPWTDLYAVGIVAWELFVGHVPFRDSETAVAILLRQIHEAIPSAHSVKPSVDEGISAWIDRLLVKDPEQRVRSAAEAWDDLEQIVTGLLGACWRREARLHDRTATRAVDRPLTPAPFAVTIDDPEPAATAPAAPTPAPALAAAPAAAVVPEPAAPYRRPWTDRPARTARWRVAATLAVAAVVAAAAGLLLAGSGGSAVPAARASTVLGNSGLEVRAPTSWQRVDLAPGASRLGLTEARGAAADRARTLGIEAGLAEYTSRSPLTRGAVRAVTGRIPAPVAVRLGGDVQAYRYDRLRLTGDRGLVTIYAVPTTNWVLTLGCFAPASQAARLDAVCGSVAATLRPTSGRPVPVGPSADYARGIADALAPLKAGAGRTEATLGRATSASAQAEAATRLARLHEQAAEALQLVPGRVLDGLVIEPLVGAARDAAKAYRRLAAAARAGAPADYDSARRAIRAARGSLDDARRGLARGGYEVRSS